MRSEPVRADVTAQAPISVTGLRLIDRGLVGELRDLGSHERQRLRDGLERNLRVQVVVDRGHDGRERQRCVRKSVDVDPGGRFVGGHPPIEKPLGLLVKVGPECSAEIQSRADFVTA